MQCTMNEKPSIKLTHYDDTKKRDPGSQIVRAKENMKLSCHFSQTCNRVTFLHFHQNSVCSQNVDLLRPRFVYTLSLTR